MQAHALEGKLCSPNFQKMRKRNFFKLARIRFEKNVSELQKSEKHACEILIWVKKRQSYFFQKNVFLRQRR